MCGIVGYVGKKDCTKVLLDSLSKLEYRGYDSAGIAVFEQKVDKIVENGIKKTKERLWKSILVAGGQIGYNRATIAERSCALWQRHRRSSLWRGNTTLSRPPTGRYWK